METEEKTYHIKRASATECFAGDAIVAGNHEYSSG